MKKIYKYLMISEIVAIIILVLAFLLNLSQHLFGVNILSAVGGFLLIFPPYITSPIFKFFPQEGGGDLIPLLMFDFVFYSIISMVVGLIIYRFKRKNE